MRRAQNAGTHALKQHRLSQNISPVCSSFVLVIVSDMHLESESEKRAKTLIYTQLKTTHTHTHTHTHNNNNNNKQTKTDTTNTFSLFLDEFSETDLRPIYCRLTTLQWLLTIVGAGESLFPSLVLGTFVVMLISLILSALLLRTETRGEVWTGHRGRGF